MAAGDGIPEFVTPYNTSEFEAMVAAVKAHFNALKGQAEVVGADLGRLLPNARNVGGNPWMVGLDLKMAARQIRRQFNQAAAAQVSASAAIDKAMQFYHGNFTSAGTGAHGRTFDAGK